MQAWEEKILDKRKAYEEGRKQLLQEQIKKNMEKGRELEEIADFLGMDVETIQCLIQENESEKE